MPEPPTNYSPTWEGDTRTELPLVGDALALWRAQCDISRAIVAACPDLDATGVHVWTGRPVSLRRVLVHMIAEYARHDGHADLLRERIDGRTGL